MAVLSLPARQPLDAHPRPILPSALVREWDLCKVHLISEKKLVKALTSEEAKAMAGANLAHEVVVGSPVANSLMTQDCCARRAPVLPVISSREACWKRWHCEWHGKFLYAVLA